MLLVFKTLKYKGSKKKKVFNISTTILRHFGESLTKLMLNDITTKRA